MKSQLREAWDRASIETRAAFLQNVGLVTLEEHLDVLREVRDTQRFGATRGVYGSPVHP